MEKAVMEENGLEKILQSFDSTATLDEIVQEALLDFTDDYVNAVCQKACEVAEHRGSKRVEVRDVYYAMEHFFK